MSRRVPVAEVLAKCSITEAMLDHIREGLPWRGTANTDYPELVESLRTHGQLQPILVRRRPGFNDQLWLPVNCMHRLAAAVDLQWDSILVEFVSLEAAA